VTSALLLDTNALFFRAHYALPPMNTSSGEPTSAIYGFSSLLLKLLREERPEGIAFARDLPQPTFRHERYAEYKAGRPAAPDTLRPQWARLDALIAGLGVPAVAVPGFEADDVLATMARRLSAAGTSVKIVTGDRDLFQVVGPRVRVIFVGARGQKAETLDEAAVTARYGVVPAQLPMLSGLIGEAADNLIGVTGVGLRTASKLVQQYGSATRLLADVDAITPPKLRDALRAAGDRIRMNEELARLRDDLDLGDGPLVSALGPEALEHLRALFAELEFKSLAARLDALGAQRATSTD
jgi:DNA polymerase-1